MGIIAAIKVGYKTFLLRTLLDIFDDPGGFKRDEKARARQKRGFCGVDYGGKPTVLDAMNFLVAVWKDSKRYVSEDSIKRCWRKANILPA